MNSEETMDSVKLRIGIIEKTIVNTQFDIPDKENKTNPAIESKVSDPESQDTTLSNSADQGESNDNNNCTAHNADDTNESGITQEVTDPKTNDTKI